MAGSSTLSDNVWPGYVAAMASLLLGLLLVAALLTITTSQVGTIQEGYVQAIRKLGYSSNKQILDVARSLGVDVDAVLDEVSGKSAQTAPGEVPVSRSNGSEKMGQAASASVLEVHKLLDFSRFAYDRAAARLAMERLSKADAQLLQQVDLSRIDLSKIRFTASVRELELASAITPQMIAQADFSLVDLGHIDARLQERVKPFLARLVMEILIEKKTLARNAAATPLPETRRSEPVRPLPELTSQGDPDLLLDFVDRVQMPDARVLDEVRTRLRQMRKGQQTLQIWVQDQPEADAAQTRSANRQMLQIRNLALQEGWPADRVKVKYSKTSVTASHQEGFHIHISTLNGANE